MINNKKDDLDFSTLKKEKMESVWDRFRKMQPQCGFGLLGICCKNCFMGPCRINPFEEEMQRGVCGASGDTIVARNFCRMIAAGAAAHSDHAREVALVFLQVAKGILENYEIKDEIKLRATANIYGIDINNKNKEQIAEDLALKILTEFSKQEGSLQFINCAPYKRQQTWKAQKITPRGIDREIVELMHRTNMGVDQDYKNLMLQASRTALADGWGGSMIATELQDILFGTPVPLRAKVNLGVLKKDKVNIIVHGHEPLLSEIIVKIAKDSELINLAKSKGANGINIAGICCTANEVLMRHGIPIAGNFLQQELAIMTGAVEVMLVDVQCIMSSLPQIAQCYHTKIITTSSKAKMRDVTHIEFNEHNANDIAKNIIKQAIENYSNRKDVDIPNKEVDLIAGFSHETINYMLGGKYRGSYRPLNDNIINGRIKGVVGVVGCNNPKVKHDYIHTTLVKELIANDILVVQTGCSAIACAKEGLMIPEAASLAGNGLAEICETVGIPPVLHCGSCVDNSRILIAASEIVKEGGLGDDISKLPVVGVAPEWMSEKAIAIGQYFVASGVYTIFGIGLPILGSKNFKKYLFEDIEKETGGKWGQEKEPSKIVNLIIDHINKKREDLGIQKPQERILFDMAARRKLEE